MKAGRQVAEALRRDPSEIGRARHLVGAALASWGLDDERNALELAVSELVSNALQHGSGDVWVGLDVDDERIRLEVRDQGGGRPAIREADQATGELGGWGLRFVDELADEWGTVSRPGLTCVWLVRRRR